MNCQAELPVRKKEILFTYLQFLYPQHLLAALMFHATRSRLGPFKNRFIRWFIRRYDIDMQLATSPDPASYPDFNTFFTRSLRPGARPIESATDTVLSPADGAVSQIGRIEEGRVLQAKQHSYSVAALLGGDQDRAKYFDRGRFVTIYLSPRDYHRVHMPVEGCLQKMVYVPGSLFSVNDATTRVLPGLFARNERLITHFETAIGPMALVMVGAIFVSALETVWHGLVSPPRARQIRAWDYDKDQVLTRGEEMGRFNMGSTVVVLLSPDSVDWLPALEPGASVQMGQAIGRTTGARI